MLDYTSGQGTVMEHVPDILMENLDQGVFVLDPQGRCLEINRCLAQWLGRHAVDLIGRALQELFAGRPDRYRASLQRALQGERCEYEDLTLLGDELHTWRVLLLPVRDDDGEVAGAIGLCRDVTEDRRRDEELRQARELAPPEQSAAGLTHDLRNLLTVIRGHLDLLVPRADQEMQQELRPLVQATERAVELSARFLTTARRRALPRDPTDLNAIMTEVAALLRPRLGPCVFFDVRARAPLPRVAGDSSQLHRLLLNLCLNALNAMAGGGRLRLETDAVRFGPEDGEAHPQSRPGLFVCLTVADSGPGMPPRAQQHLAELVAHGRREGDGIGLSVVAAIVERHDGWLECTSRPGAGTRFQVFLPAIA